MTQPDLFLIIEPRLVVPPKARVKRGFSDQWTCAGKRRKVQ